MFLLPPILSPDTSEAPEQSLPCRRNWKGVYGQDMISFADDRLHLLLEGRYDWADFGIRV